MREVEKVRGAGGWKKCGVREIEKSVECGRFKKLPGWWINCGVQGGWNNLGWVKNCRADDKLQGRWNLQRGWKVVGAEIRWSKLWLIIWELRKYFFGKKSQSLHVNSELSQGELSHRHSKQNVLILVLVVPDNYISCRCSVSHLHVISF